MYFGENCSENLHPKICQNLPYSCVQKLKKNLIIVFTQPYSRTIIIKENILPEKTSYWYNHTILYVCWIINNKITILTQNIIFWRVAKADQLYFFWIGTWIEPWWTKIGKIIVLLYPPDMMWTFYRCILSWMENKLVREKWTKLKLIQWPNNPF